MARLRFGSATGRARIGLRWCPSPARRLRPWIFARGVLHAPGCRGTRRPGRQPRRHPTEAVRQAVQQGRGTDFLTSSGGHLDWNTCVEKSDNPEAHTACLGSKLEPKHVIGWSMDYLPVTPSPSSGAASASCDAREWPRCAVFSLQTVNRRPYAGRHRERPVRHWGSSYALGSSEATGPAAGSAMTVAADARRHAATAARLKELADPDLYRRNAFRRTGLSPHAAHNDIRDRRRKVRVPRRRGCGAPTPLRVEDPAEHLRFEEELRPMGRCMVRCAWGCEAATVSQAGWRVGGVRGCRGRRSGPAAGLGGQAILRLPGRKPCG